MYSNAVRWAFVCLFSVASWAQSDTGTITGVVRDTSTAAVPRVKITVTDAPTNADVFTGITDATGGYRAPALKPSDYVLTAEMTGFKKEMRRGINLEVNQVEPVVEIYQGDRQNYEMPNAPRAMSEKDAIGGYRPKGFVNLALAKGYRLGFQASSDHVSTHMSYCNIFVKDATRESVLDGLKQRHVYGATDNILADVRSGTHMMGDAFSTPTRPALQVSLTGTSKFAKVYIVKDNNYVYTIEPHSQAVSFSWIDNAAEPSKTSYYYVRGEQDNGEIVWVSPMWITYTGK